MARTRPVRSFSRSPGRSLGSDVSPRDPHALLHRVERKVDGVWEMLDYVYRDIDEADADAKIMTQKWGWRHRRVTYKRVPLVGGDD